MKRSAGSWRMILSLTFIVGLLGICEQVSGRCIGPVFQNAKKISADMSGYRVGTSAVESLHSTSLQKHLHKGDLYMQYFFHKEFTFGPNRYLLSRYTCFDIFMPRIACMHYGGKIPELRSEEEQAALGHFLSDNAHLRDCIYIGMEQYNSGNWFYFSTFSKAFKGANVTTNGHCAMLKRNARSRWEMHSAYCSEGECHVVCQLHK